MREAIRLQVVDSIPAGLLDVAASELHRIVAGPTLILLAGRRSPPLFVSVLLHGNEDVGLRAIQRVLRAHAGRPLPRALAIFIGNVEAARLGVRRLDEQPDYNRVWPGTLEPESPEHALMAEVTRAMRARGVFASIDLHNNTGLNPHYACVTQLASPSLQLASIFSRTAVYFERPAGTQTSAFGVFAPAVACECGKVGDESGIAHAADFVDSVLRMNEIPAHAVRTGDLHLYRTVATVRVPPAVTISFDDGDADLRFVREIDHMNFRDVAPGTLFAFRRPGSGAMLDIRDEHDLPCAARFIDVRDDQLRFAHAVTPSMLSADEQVVRLDSLCYLMRRLELPD